MDMQQPNRKMEITTTSATISPTNQRHGHQHWEGPRPPGKGAQGKQRLDYKIPSPPENLSLTALTRCRIMAC